MNPYFTVNDSEHFTFYRIPKLLFTDEIYQTVSTDAKMLYGLLLDRLSLSEKNDWKDEHGRVYQYFTIHQAQVCGAGCSRPYRAPPSGAGQGQPHLLKGVYPKVRLSEFQKSGNRKEIRLRE